MDSALQKSLHCPDPSQELKGYKLMNVHWSSRKPGAFIRCGQERVKAAEVFTVRADVILNCAQLETGYEVDIPFDVSSEKCVSPPIYILDQMDSLIVKKKSFDFQ